MFAIMKLLIPGVLDCFKSRARLEAEMTVFLPNIFTWRVRSMGIRGRPITPRSPWQNGYVEPVIGSIPRGCLDHIIVLGEAHLRRVLSAYAGYYNATRTHLAMVKDAPDHRPIQRHGTIFSSSVLGRLHHKYARI